MIRYLSSAVPSSKINVSIAVVFVSVKVVVLINIIVKVEYMSTYIIFKM